MGFCVCEKDGAVGDAAREKTSCYFLPPHISPTCLSVSLSSLCICGWPAFPHAPWIFLDLRKEWDSSDLKNNNKKKQLWNTCHDLWLSSTFQVYPKKLAKPVLDDHQIIFKAHLPSGKLWLLVSFYYFGSCTLCWPFWKTCGREISLKRGTFAFGF